MIPQLQTNTKIIVTVYVDKVYGNKANMQQQSLNAEPILESKGMRAIFQKKGKMFENLGKYVQNLKIFL